MKRSNDWVSASDIGRACYCPKSLTHKYAGTEVSQSAIAARRRGDAAHDALNQEVEDTRCFVASHLWGVSDPRTLLLRRFRDEHLMRHLPGRYLVEIYYRLSPSLVVAARRFKPLDIALRWIAARIICRLQQREGKIIASFDHKDGV